MRRVLLTVVFSVCISSACAHAGTPPPGSVLVAENAAHMALQLGPEAVKVSTKNNETQVRTVSQNPTGEAPNRDSSGWRTYGTLLATLVLMGAIALRRHKSGKL